MAVLVLRLALGGLWLGLAAVVFARHRLPIRLPARLDGPDGAVVAAVAAGLGLLNLARAYTSYRRRPPARRPGPLAPRAHRDRRPDEYHPEFDVTRPG